MATHPLPSGRPQIAPAPTLFIGIDIGKKRHVAAFASADILKRKRFEQCPLYSFDQTRTGFVGFLKRVKEYVSSPSRAAIVVESTGHYHRALCELLIEEGFSVYIVAVRSKRINGMNKTDAYDARRLAHSLYAQLSLGLQIEEKSQMARQIVPDTMVAQKLHGLVRRYYEVTQSVTRTKNKLVAICDELFPEFTEAFKDPCLPIALDIRARWPTPAIIASKTLEELRAVKRIHHPGDRKLLALQKAAQNSIGVTSETRVATLVLEQSQLIEAMLILTRQAETLENQIEAIVTESREGKILLSMPSMGPIHAGTLIAMIGNIRNFPRKCELRKYCGWAPRSTQTGSSVDRADMVPTGARLLRYTFYLLTISAVSHHTTFFGQLYDRLVPLKCSYDARKKVYKGKMRVIGRVAGQYVGIVYTLLKRDADLVDSLAGQSEPLPEPELYDPAIHSGSKVKPSLDSEVMIV